MTIGLYWRWKELIVGADGEGLPRAVDYALGLVHICLRQAARRSSKLSP